MKGPNLNNVEIKRYSIKYLKDLTSLAAKVNRLDASYPPPDDVSVMAENWSGWLFGEKVVDRIIALKDDKVAGHIILTPPHEYIKPYLVSNEKYFEVGQFFVDPEVQKSGIGKKLFSEAFNSAHSFDRKLALCVLEGSQDAQRFYQHNGLRLAESFSGRDGLNLVFLED